MSREARKIVSDFYLSEQKNTDQASTLMKLATCTLYQVDLGFEDTDLATAARDGKLE